MGSCAAPSAKGDDKFITTDYLQQCPHKAHAVGLSGRVVPFKHQLCTSFKDPLINPVNT
ncbi:TPA: hypothetical protein MFM57_005224 [Klebsiella pneumoniae]|uniref:Mobile element protein n=1 Tax=Klebsiella quasipneumoniae TaxID=1463165 RepID=A0A6B7Q2M0_9ENTR|nr:hypothetical protein [Klebsiella quasipneumoniae]HBW8376428.1 hypothetical protein [Klebsiella pneumoniae]HBW8416080.1 hypothetical protein [Klebsiella pneumoniae]HBW8565162.1 hypothetical protein [Klebsiella pneumoniae]